MEIIPAVNCSDEACVKARLMAVQALGAAWAHVDVSDGVFTSHRSWSDPEAFAKFHDPEALSVEVHCMVADPVAAARQWRAAGAARLIVHAEALSPESFAALAGECAEAEVELGVAIRPDTPVEDVLPYLGEITFVQLLAVSPGPSGQEFNEAIFEKLEFLRDRAPEITIEVDGGVTPEIARRLKEAGVNAVTSGSYIWNERDPRTAYQELLNA